MPLSSGERLGPYAILAPIGEGGMGQVYRAKDTKLKREVALKVLPDLGMVPAFCSKAAISFSAPSTRNLRHSGEK